MFAINGSLPTEHAAEFSAFLNAIRRSAACRKKVLAKGLFKTSDQQWIEHQFRKYRKDLRDLNECHRAGDAKGERAATERLLRGFAGRACAVLRLHLDKKEPELPSPLSRAAFEEVVNSFDLYKQMPGKAQLVLIPKSGGEHRPTLKFGWEVKAAQFLVQDVLHAKGLNNPYEYNRAKHGRDRAADTVRDDIERGYHHWLIGDIKDCYSSIKPKHLKWLDLPPMVMKHSVFVNADIPIDCHGNQSVYLKAARQGLAQGAMLSGIIASGLIGRVLRTIPGDIGVRSYSDDIGICARSPAATATIRNAVKSSFHNLKAGPLTFKFLETADARAGFSYLNYHFRLEDHGEDEHVHIFPDRAAFKNLWARVNHLLHHYEGAIELRAQTVHDYVKRWRISQKSWTLNPHSIKLLNFSVDQMIDDHGTSAQFKHAPVYNCIGSHSQNAPLAEK